MPPRADCSGSTKITAYNPGQQSKIMRKWKNTTITSDEPSLQFLVKLFLKMKAWIEYPASPHRTETFSKSVWNEIWEYRSLNRQVMQPAGNTRSPTPRIRYSY